MPGLDKYQHAKSTKWGKEINGNYKGLVSY